jgi:hypothetical protein
LHFLCDRIRALTRTAAAKVSPSQAKPFYGSETLSRFHATKTLIGHFGLSARRSTRRLTMSILGALSELRSPSFADQNEGRPDRGMRVYQRAVVY